MNITDELRNFANEWDWLDYRADESARRLIAIANRIDMEHERRMIERADRYSELRAKMNNCYIELPKDADDVPVRVGDELCNYTLSGYPYPNGGVYCKAIVNERMVLVGQKDSSFNDLLMWEARWCHHYHAPTVEDILLEACKAYHGLMVEGMSDFARDMPAPSEIIAEYAAKLQLKED